MSARLRELDREVRKMRAPRSNAAIAAPTLPCTRADAAWTPLNSPTNRLRETPTITGYPHAANRSREASTRSE